MLKHIQEKLRFVIYKNKTATKKESWKQKNNNPALPKAKQAPTKRKYNFKRN